MADVGTELDLVEIGGRDQKQLIARLRRVDQAFTGRRVPYTFAGYDGLSLGFGGRFHVVKVWVRLTDAALARQIVSEIA